jgi:hypothetical protein
MTTAPPPAKPDWRKALTELPRLILVEPLTEGRLDWRSWPRALRLVSLASLVLYAVTTVVILFASSIRTSQPLVVGTGDELLPQIAIPFLTLMSLWCICLLQTSALAAHWTIKLGALSVSGLVLLTFGFFGGTASPVSAIIAAACFLGLLVYTAVRWRSRLAAGDFLAVTILITVGTMGPVIEGAPRAIGFGFDFRPGLLQGLLTSLLTLALPALFASGGALMQIVVTTAESVSSVIRDFARTWVLIAAIVVALAVRGFQVWGDVSESGLSELVPIGPLIAVAMGAAAVACVWLVSKRGTQELIGPGESSEVWGRHLFPLALGFGATALIMAPLIVLSVLALFPGLEFLSPLQALNGVATGSFTPVAARVLVGVIAFGIAFARARKGRLVSATLLATFLVIPVYDLLSVTVGGIFLNDVAGPGLALVMTMGAVVCIIASAVQRFRRATPVFAALAMLVASSLYSAREILDDPTTALLGFGGGAAIFVGLLWRVLTDGSFTRSGSRGMPVTTRVLLFWANALFGVMALAYVGLARPESGQFSDLEQFVVVGDTYFGTPLMLTLLITGVAAAFSTRSKVVPMSDALAGEDDEVQAGVTPQPMPVQGAVASGAHGAFPGVHGGFPQPQAAPPRQAPGYPAVPFPPGPAQPGPPQPQPPPPPRYPAMPQSAPQAPDPAGIATPPRRSAPE